MTFWEETISEIREGNRKGLRARKWKTSLFCLLRADWTQCKVDRTAKRYDSNPRRSGKRRGVKWRERWRGRGGEDERGGGEEKVIEESDRTDRAAKMN